MKGDPCGQNVNRSRETPARVENVSAAAARAGHFPKTEGPLKIIRPDALCRFKLEETSSIRYFHDDSVLTRKMCLEMTKR